MGLLLRQQFRPVCSVTGCCSCELRVRTSGLCTWRVLPPMHAVSFSCNARMYFPKLQEFQLVGPIVSGLRSLYAYATSCTWKVHPQFEHSPWDFEDLLRE